MVVNRSATLPASLPAVGPFGPFLLNLSTHYSSPEKFPSTPFEIEAKQSFSEGKYGNDLWLTEPRWSESRPGPMPIEAGSTVDVAGMTARFVTPHAGLPRLWFVQFQGDVERAIMQHGRPIRYGYVREQYPLTMYQTIFGNRPGSAEMPSAGRPFTKEVLQSLRRRGVGVADITLHTGISSHEVETEDLEEQTMYAEPFWVPRATAMAVNSARQAGRRVIAVGTTVVRALESAWNGKEVIPAQGFTRLYIHPGREIHTLTGLISGLHDSMASHLAMLYAIADPSQIRTAYEEAVMEGYLWHEFGDSHLIL
ncbi:S-adenosylmethionine:tRNA ribosyltransferase-isomerase [Chloroflexi bacterium TSY]|nr:S-adenosylmethionine:tRNA ribosyltransferase-isomerase [Chloroflexi bacterium TSY]